MINGKAYLDRDGNKIHAHGGCIIRHGDWWYWYGEDRRDNRYVSCYRSADLVDWEWRDTVLSADSPVMGDVPGRNPKLKEIEPDGTLRKVNIERPKVLYNEKTEKFVMWAHYENGTDYKEACACVAISDTPDGEFTYIGSFRPCGCMSRDCTLYRDDDGAVYFISAARDNADLHVYRLTEDYLDVAEQVNKLYADGYREAPAVFKKDGMYYMITSYCTGWAPNQGKWSSAERMEGKWSALADFGDETTYGSQSAFVLPVEDEAGKRRYYYIGDRWCGGGEAYFSSTYVVLEIQFDEKGHPYIEFTEKAPVM